MRKHLFAASLLAVAAGCASTSVIQPAGSNNPTAPTSSPPADASPDAPPGDASPGTAPANPGAPTPEGQATVSCRDAQFVACQDGEACTRRGTDFVRPVRCFDRAADACDAASCEHGCDIYGTYLGGPELVICAVNAASTGHMEICGGIANWRCPENMRCELPTGRGRALDATGQCVASTPQRAASPRHGVASTP